MILTGKQIAQEVYSKRIIIDPFDSASLNPNSYNFRLGHIIKTYKAGYLDAKTHNDCIVTTIDQEHGMLLAPNQLYLGHTYERMGSDYYVPLISGRSSTGRLGLFVHITAPLGDIGYHGCWTLQLKATIPLRVYPGQRIGQIIFVMPWGTRKLYQGKYSHKAEPQEYRLSRYAEARNRTKMV